MDANHEIRLRLRFYKDVNETIAVIKKKFEDYEIKTSEDYFLKIKENHIWLNIAGSKKEYWSPHLHLELESKSENETHIRGLFGPDPTLWTFFMFLHFMVGGVFIIFSMIAYSNFVLKNSVTFDLIIMGLMVVVWFLLYIIAKQIRENGNGQMNDLEALFEEIIKS